MLTLKSSLTSRIKQMSVYQAHTHTYIHEKEIARHTGRQRQTSVSGSLLKEVFEGIGKNGDNFQELKSNKRQPSCKSRHLPR